MRVKPPATYSCDPAIARAEARALGAGFQDVSWAPFAAESFTRNWVPEAVDRSPPTYTEPPAATMEETMPYVGHPAFHDGTAAPVPASGSLAIEVRTRPDTS
jgi:hypothetical protein